MQRLIIQEKSARGFLAKHRALLVRLALLAFGLVLLIGLAAPFVNAGAFRPAIQNSLQESLGRNVEIEKVHFSLFTGPGFVLDRVTIQEDPRYGLEPFAFIPTLEVRVRLDKLLLGQIRPLGLRMVDASLNLVKSDDGTWNAVSLVERLGAPRRSPLDFFPAVEISNSRIDFKLGLRKTTLYIMDADVSVYPERSGKIYFKFEGSPARTDRAGNGFGHLTGTANWYLKPTSAKANQLEADVNLEPSNLSELATLFQGQDIGVHGNVSGHVLISGPFSDLRALGSVQLEDVHRWDLLPSPGDNWRVKFRADVDLNAHKLDLTTLPLDSGEAPAVLQVRANDFMTHPSWSMLASLKKAPLASLLPLGRRMGIALPAGLRMDGALDGVVGLSNATGLEGGVLITNAVANIPDVPPLRSASANVTISNNVIHVDPAILQVESGGTLRAGGDFDLGSQGMTVQISANQFSISAFKQTINAWFGSPQALALATAGNLSGNFAVSDSVAHKAIWSGQMQFNNATASIPGVAVPIERLSGRATFDDETFDLQRFTGVIAKNPFSGSYRYSVNAKRTEHLRLVLPQADLMQLESALTPALTDNSLLSHLPFTRRTIPPWLADRNLEGELSVSRLNLGDKPLGQLAAHVVWQGTQVELTSVQVTLDNGNVQAEGAVNLAARLPRYHFTAAMHDYAWQGALWSAEGEFDSSGIGATTLQNLKGTGTFTTNDVTFAGSDAFSDLSGQFSIAGDNDPAWLKLTGVEARQDDQDWTGDGDVDRDGKVHFDLTSGARQLHLASNLAPSSKEVSVPADNH